MVLQLCLKNVEHTHPKEDGDKEYLGALLFFWVVFLWVSLLAHLSLVWCCFLLLGGAGFLSSFCVVTSSLQFLSCGGAGGGS